MIKYKHGLLGCMLMRVHGSSIFKGMIFGLISVGIYFVLLIWSEDWRESSWWGYRFPSAANGEGSKTTRVDHPGAVAMMIGSMSFLIVFRANKGYSRYWEAASAIHHMMSKWLDSTSHLGVYHLQQRHFDTIKPQTYFDNFALNDFGLTRDREYVVGETSVGGHGKKRKLLRHSTSSLGTFPYQNDDDGWDVLLNKDGTRDEKGGGGGGGDLTAEKIEKRSSTARSINRVYGAGKRDLFHCEEGCATKAQDEHTRRTHGTSSISISIPSHIERPSKSHPMLTGPPRLDGGWDLAPERQARSSPPPGGYTPPLFLQELCHLSSLMVAVAFTTLRCSMDLEDFPAPLTTYIPGKNWPEDDPDNLPKEVRRQYGPRSWLLTNIMYWVGFDRTLRRRSMYNSSRPLQVLGGVSQAELICLQRARGASAKTQLAWNWLSEFFIREQLAGSLGKVHPAIVSRSIQFISEGMQHYNRARKIMFIPFPFPNSQMSMFFIFCIIWAVPIVHAEYVSLVPLGAVLTFCTVSCLAGLHEVARELENPFRNVPNDLPLDGLLARYNEALLMLFNGYHPDFYWDANTAKSNMDEKERYGCDGGSSGALKAILPDEDRSKKANADKPTPSLSIRELQQKSEDQAETIRILRRELEMAAASSKAQRAQKVQKEKSMDAKMRRQFNEGKGGRVLPAPQR